MEQWESYQKYVKEHDLGYPKEELSRLAGLIENVKNGEKEVYLNGYTTVNTPFSRRFHYVHLTTCVRLEEIIDH